MLLFGELVIRDIPRKGGREEHCVLSLDISCCQHYVCQMGILRKRGYKKGNPLDFGTSRIRSSEKGEIIVSIRIRSWHHYSLRDFISNQVQ